MWLIISQKCPTFFLLYFIFFAKLSTVRSAGIDHDGSQVPGCAAQLIVVILSPHLEVHIVVVDISVLKAAVPRAGSSYNHHGVLESGRSGVGDVHGEVWSGSPGHGVELEDLGGLEVGATPNDDKFGASGLILALDNL